MKRKQSKMVRMSSPMIAIVAEMDTAVMVPGIHIGMRGFRWCQHMRKLVSQSIWRQGICSSLRSCLFVSVLGAYRDFVGEQYKV